MEIFSKRLKKARCIKKITLINLAGKINVDKSTIKKFETGEIEPSLSTLVAISEALDISVLYLLGLSDQQLPASFGNANTLTINFNEIDSERLMKDMKAFKEYLQQKKGQKKEHNNYFILYLERR